MSSSNDSCDRLLLEALHTWIGMVHDCLPETLPVRQKCDLDKLHNQVCRTRNDRDFSSAVDRYLGAVKAPECRGWLDREYFRKVDRAFRVIMGIFEELRRDLSKV